MDEDTPPLARRILASALFIGLAVLLSLGVRFAIWRAGKVAGLDPVAITRPMPSRPEPFQPADPPTLLLFGDSRMAEWQPLPDRPYDIAVEAYPGETAIRLAGQFPAALRAHAPAVVLVQAGGNDAIAAALVGPAARARALANSLAAYDEMAAAAKAAGAQLLFLCTLPPLRPPLYRRLVYRGAVDSYLAQLNAALPAIAARNGAAVVDPLPLLAGADGRIPDRFRRDSLHWTAAAYLALAALLPQSIASGDGPAEGPRGALPPVPSAPSGLPCRSG